MAEKGQEIPRRLAYLVDLVEADEAVCLTDVVLTEILQGLRSERDVPRVERRLSAFDVLRLEDLDDFRRAAALYRQARAAGYTARLPDRLGLPVRTPGPSTRTPTSTTSPPAPLSPR